MMILIAPNDPAGRELPESVSFIIFYIVLQVLRCFLMFFDGFGWFQMVWKGLEGFGRVWEGLGGVGRGGEGWGGVGRAVCDPTTRKTPSNSAVSLNVDACTILPSFFLAL